MKSAKYVLLIIILIATALSLYDLFFLEHSLWWDAAVYIGMGKYIFSLGHEGFFEASRPLILPMIFGGIWKLGLDPVFFGKIMFIFFSGGSIYLSYLIAKRFFDDRVALLSSFFLAFSQTFLLYSENLHTEVPSLFFVLLSLYLFLKGRINLSGFCVGIAFLTRFFFIFAFIGMMFYLLANKRIKDWLRFSAFFAIPILPYLLLNYFLYKDLFYPFFLQAEMTSSSALFWTQPWYFYFKDLFMENIFVVFAVLGIVFILKNEKIRIIGILIIFTFLPFAFSEHKEMRFMLLSLPFIYMASAYTLFRMIDIFEKKARIILMSIVLIIFIVQAAHALTFDNYDDGLGGMREFLKNSSIKEPIWISNPGIIAESNRKAELLYYPLFDSKSIDYLKPKVLSAGSVFLSTCDLVCYPPISDCEARKKELINDLKLKFQLSFYEQKENCEHFVFKS